MTFNTFKNRMAMLFTLLFLIAANGREAVALVEGCDPKVMSALEAKATAKAAYDTAEVQQIIKRPESALAMTCFNEQAGSVAATAGGAESFTGPLDVSIITANLNDVYKSPSNTDFSPSSLPDSANCQRMRTAWEETENTGVEGDTTVPSLKDMMDGTKPPGIAAGSAFDRNFQSSQAQGVFSDLNAAVTALPEPDVKDYTNTSSSCDVLQAAGVVSGGCTGAGP